MSPSFGPSTSGTRHELWRNPSLNYFKKIKNKPLFERSQSAFLSSFSTLYLLFHHFKPTYPSWFAQVIFNTYSWAALKHLCIWDMLLLRLVLLALSELLQLMHLCIFHLTYITSYTWCTARNTNPVRQERFSHLETTSACS